MNRCRYAPDVCAFVRNEPDGAVVRQRLRIRMPLLKSRPSLFGNQKSQRGALLSDGGESLQRETLFASGCALALAV
jgi:hypothetical protein